MVTSINLIPMRDQVDILGTQLRPDKQELTPSTVVEVKLVVV